MTETENFLGNLLARINTAPPEERKKYYAEIVELAMDGVAELFGALIQVDPAKLDKDNVFTHALKLVAEAYEAQSTEQMADLVQRGVFYTLAMAKELEGRES